MHHVLDAVLVHAAAELGGIGDVALEEAHALEALVPHQVPDPAGLAAEVEDHRAVAAGEQALDDPGSDAAEGAGDEEGAVAHGCAT